MYLGTKFLSTVFTKFVIVFLHQFNENVCLDAILVPCYNVYSKDHTK